VDYRNSLPTWTLPFRILFLAAIGCLTLPIYFGCLLRDLSSSWLFSSTKSKRRIGRFTAWVIGFTWRIALGLCPWIRLDCKGLNTLSAAGRSGRPVFIAMNHTSFFDSVMFCALCPFRLIGDAKTLMSKAVLKMPLLGRMATVVGHLPVPFRRPDKANDFSVDKEVLRDIMGKLDAHIDAGGHVALFPEGSLNRVNNRQLCLFRAGGFETAIRHDMEVWGWVMTGNADCWPANCAIGGAPCKIRGKAVLLHSSAREACKRLLPESTDDDIRAQALALAQDVQRTMQGMLDELYEGR